MHSIPPPPPENTPRPRHSFAYELVVLKLAFIDLARAIELSPRYTELRGDAFALATFIADELRLEARR